MKKDPKIILVVLITALALAVFVWSFIKKNKKEETTAESSTTNSVQEQDAYLAVEPTNTPQEKTVPVPLKTALDVVTIEVPTYEPELRAFEYIMNHQGTIVQGSYNDSMLPDYEGQAESVRREEKNGTVFEVKVSSYTISAATNAGEADEQNSKKGIVVPVSSKIGAQKKGATIRPIKINKVSQTPNSAVLTITKGGAVLKWKMIDLVTGAVYNGIQGFEEAGAAHKEGDSSKKVYYLN